MSRTLGKITNAIRRLIGSPQRWSDTVDDFNPVHPTPRWGYGRPAHPEIARLLQSGSAAYAEQLHAFAAFRTDFAAVPADSTDPALPHWDNGWFGGLDAAALMALIALRKPGRYVEIGSGMSTRFTHHIVRLKNPPTQITSIDPSPRSDVDMLCDSILRQPLEEIDPTFFETLAPGDILFFDGSHRVFTNSDVTAFFFDVLPRLKPGILVHLHDIFWPDDYPPEWNARLYSEQYLLGALLLGNARKLRIVLPNHFVVRDASLAPLVAALGIPPKALARGASSFWLETE
jgi:hypothetical protein